MAHVSKLRTAAILLGLARSQIYLPHSSFDLIYIILLFDYVWGFGVPKPHAQIIIIIKMKQLIAAFCLAYAIALSVPTPHDTFCSDGVQTQYNATNHS